jgi:hypothetical protein
MAVGPYADVHLPRPVIWQFRDRGVDILAATEKQTNELPDDELLRLATSLSRVVVTQDIRFRVMAENWQRSGRTFAGLVFAPTSREWLCVPASTSCLREFDDRRPILSLK